MEAQRCRRLRHCVLCLYICSVLFVVITQTRLRGYLSPSIKDNGPRNIDVKPVDHAYLTDFQGRKFMPKTKKREPSSNKGHIRTSPRKIISPKSKSYSHSNVLDKVPFEEGSHSVKLPTDSKFAYVTYATDDTYTCAAMVMLDSIKKTKANRAIDLVILHTQTVSKAYIARIRVKGMIPIAVPELKAINSIPDATWSNSITKFNIFALEQYRRVVFIEADAMVLRNLDHLFLLPANVMYGVEAREIKTHVSLNSQLLVIEPDATKVKELLQHQYAIEEAKKTHDFTRYPKLKIYHRTQTLYDTDILNIVYGDTFTYLPSRYVISNADLLRSPDLSKWKLSVSEEFAVGAFVIHFLQSPNGEKGKPWNTKTHHVYMPTGARPLYKHLFRRFWRRKKNLCIS